jgi:hypothetical protein
MERCYDVSAGQGGIWFRTPVLWKYKVWMIVDVKEPSQSNSLNC